MAGIDYGGIKTALKTHLEAQADLDGVTVEIEGGLEMPAEQCPWVGIYLAARRADPDQPLAGGTRWRAELDLALVAAAYSGESRETAIVARDALLADLEVAVLRLVSTGLLGGTVALLRLTGGPTPSGQDGAGFLSVGELGVTVEAVATT